MEPRPMKMLLDRKVRRGEIVQDWLPAEHHLTHDGQNEFHARMLARIKAADAARAAKTNVAPIRKGKKA